MKFVLSGCKMSKSLPPPTRVLKVYIEALAGFSHVYRPDGPNTTSLSRLCAWDSLWNREGKWDTHTKDGEGLRSLLTADCQGPAHGQQDRSVTSLNSEPEGQVH